MFPMPNATDPSRHAAVQLPVRGTKSRGCGRSGAAGRLERRAEGTTFYSRLQFGHEVCARGYVSARMRRICSCRATGRRCGTPTTSTPFSIVEHAASTRSIRRRCSKLTVGPELLGADRLPPAQADLDARQSLDVLPGVPAVLPGGQPAQPDPEHHAWRHRTRCPTRARSAASSNRYPFDATQPDVGLHGQPDQAARDRTTSRPGSSSSASAGRRGGSPRSTARSTSTSNASNPLDMNFGFANTLLGSINSTRSRPRIRSPRAASTRSSSSSRTTGALTQQVHAGSRHAVRPCRPDLRRRSARRLLRSGQVRSGEGAEALRAGLPRQRGDVLRATVRMARNPLTGRAAQQHLHRQARAGQRRLRQRHGGRRRHAAAVREQRRSTRAARRLRVGRHRRRQDLGARRFRHQLSTATATTTSCRSSSSRR